MTQPQLQTGCEVWIFGSNGGATGGILRHRYHLAFPLSSFSFQWIDLNRSFLRASIPLFHLIESTKCLFLLHFSSPNSPKIKSQGQRNNSLPMCQPIALRQKPHNCTLKSPSQILPTTLTKRWSSIIIRMIMSSSQKRTKIGSSWHRK